MTPTIGSSSSAPPSVFDNISADLFDFHQSMVLDRTRMHAFVRAINATVVPGDVVVEIGTGTGVLAVAAARAGARKVYAIEAEPIIDIAQQVAVANSVEDRIEFINGQSTELALDERGDVLITETIGNAAFDEGILAWVSDAGKRLLKPNARHIPHSLALKAALLELPNDAAEMDRLLERVDTFDLSPLRALVVGTLAWDTLSPVSQVSEAVEMVSVDLSDPPLEIAAERELRARRPAMVHAVGIWFDAGIGPGISLSNEPGSPASSWNQGVVMLDRPFALEPGDPLRVGVTVFDGGGKWDFRIDRP